jgi:hypothetical protein
MRVISGKSHSGETMGIMRSVKETMDDAKSKELIQAILACLQIQTRAQYDELCARFVEETDAVQKNEQVEVETHFLISPTYFIHDRFSMIIFRLRDNEDRPVTDFDLILTAGLNADPNHLPQGFFVDRQRNRVYPETISYFVNRDVMKKSDPVLDINGKVVRDASDGAGTLGFKIVARPDAGFVHYFPCEFIATTDMLEKALHRNSTTLVVIRLQRVVRKNVFSVDKMTSQTTPVDFKETGRGDEIVE